MVKNVVITGATSGIGEAIARAYLEKGENIGSHRSPNRKTQSSKNRVRRSLSKSKNLDLFARCNRHDNG